MSATHNSTLLGDVFTLFMTCRQLAIDLASMPEAPPGAISKYAFYLAALRSGAGPKVVRCLVNGWDGEQHKSVVAAAADAITGQTDNEATAVISSYGLGGEQEIEVSVFVRGYRLKATFPFKPTGAGIALTQTDEEAKEIVLRLIAGWAKSVEAKPPRKKFLGLF